MLTQITKRGLNYGSIKRSSNGIRYAYHQFEILFITLRSRFQRNKFLFSWWKNRIIFQAYFDIFETPSQYFLSIAIHKMDPQVSIATTKTKNHKKQTQKTKLWICGWFSTGNWTIIADNFPFYFTLNASKIGFNWLNGILIAMESDHFYLIFELVSNKNRQKHLKIKTYIFHLAASLTMVK